MSVNLLETLFANVKHAGTSNASGSKDSVGSNLSQQELHVAQHEAALRLLNTLKSHSSKDSNSNSNCHTPNDHNTHNYHNSPAYNNEHAAAVNNNIFNTIIENIKARGITIIAY